MDAEFSEQQRRELLRIIDGLRRAIDAAVSLRAPLEELTALADQTHALAGALQARQDPSGTKPIPRYSPELDPSDPNAMIAFSPVSGRYSPLAPPVELAVEAGPPPRVLGDVSFGEAYEGPPSCVHGGIIASTYDQILALAALASRAGGPTASLTVQFRKPTPLHTPLRFEAWVERIDGRKVFVRGTCRVLSGTDGGELEGGELISEGEGMFVRFQRSSDDVAPAGVTR
jgi:acyl-coenzyme A thioesterase PaaI-like protein